ncbi:hypothetical protein S83_071189, partial [Arachis hypogaea]
LSHVSKILYKLSSFSNSPLDISAAERSLDFMFMEPLTTGDYPKSMKSIVGSRLPKFAKEQSKQLIHSYDFIGLNYYISPTMLPMHLSYCLQNQIMPLIPCQFCNRMQWCSYRSKG